MGVTRIPIIPRPEPTPEERFRQEITPRPDRTFPLIAWTFTLLLLALAAVPIAWWLS